MFEFAFQEVPGHFRLNEVVDTGAAAAPSAFREFNQLKIRNGPQDLAWLLGDFLAMTQMTRLMIGDGLFRGVSGWRRLNSDLGQPFMDILDLFVPQMSALFVGGLALQKFGIMFEV